jgi:hypothetical protein
MSGRTPTIWVGERNFYSFWNLSQGECGEHDVQIFTTPEFKASHWAFVITRFFYFHNGAMFSIIYPLHIHRNFHA